jgi:hypothetical protein
MNQDKFIQGIKGLRDNSIEEMEESLKDPPGRSPRKKDKEASDYWNSLDDREKNIIRYIISESTDMSIFSFLCVLDHVGFIEDTEEKSQFELYATKNGKRELINDGDKEELHNLFNDANHHMSKQGFKPAEPLVASKNPKTGRGWEQIKIDKMGGAKSKGGTSNNKINSIGDKNPKKQEYLKAAKKEFDL